jgi:hypothetical protein
MKLALAVAMLLWLSNLGIARADDQLLPAGQIVPCTMSEPNLSLKTTEVGDPVLCYLSTVLSFGKPLFPRGSYLTGNLVDGEKPGRLYGKGSLTIGFNRLVLPNAETLPLSVKVIAVPKYRVSPDGRIIGKGHPKRDAVAWMFPPLWPVDFANLPRRGPYPTLKGNEERVLLRVMEDALIPTPADMRSYYTPGVPPYQNPVHIGGDVVLVRKDGTAVSVVDYWYTTSEAVSFVQTRQRFGTIPIRELDLKETTRINRERGIEFKVPR